MAESVGLVESQFFTFGSATDPFTLKCGSELPEVTLAYETYGELNADASNAILVFHALTGSQHAAGHNPEIAEIGDIWTEENHLGWWDGFIGPGKPFDTDKYFVICANYLGGCYGSSGPTSINPLTGERYGGSFPTVCFADMVDSQLELIEHLGITKLHAVAGGSTGGVLALSLATRYPDKVDLVLPFASGVYTTALQRIHNYEQINAIQARMNNIGYEIGLNRVLILHQFEDEMILNKEQIQNFPFVELVIDADGFGSDGTKIRDYFQYAAEPGFEYGGFKVFYDWDTPVMTPDQIMDLTPPPAIIIFQ